MYIQGRHSHVFYRPCPVGGDIKERLKQSVQFKVLTIQSYSIDPRTYRSMTNTVGEENLSMSPIKNRIRQRNYL